MTDGKPQMHSMNPALNRAWLVPLAIFFGGAFALLWSLMTPHTTEDFGAERPVLTSRVQGHWTSLGDEGWRAAIDARRPMVGSRHEMAPEPGPEPEPRPRRRPKPDPPPQPEPHATYHHATYRLKEHDRLWNLAERFLGDGSRWQRIVDRNPGLDPDRLRAGTVIEIPMTAEEVEVHSGAARKPKKQQPRHHVVQDNETLYTIARKYRPGSRDWNWLYEANRDVVDDPDWVRSGTKLRIPSES